MRNCWNKSASCLFHEYGTDSGNLLFVYLSIVNKLCFVTHDLKTNNFWIHLKCVKIHQQPTIQASIYLSIHPSIHISSSIAFPFKILLKSADIGQFISPKRASFLKTSLAGHGVNHDGLQNVPACLNACLHVQLTYPLHPGAGLFKRTTSTCTLQAHTADGW